MVVNKEALRARARCNAHAMRNELVEELNVDREAKVLQNQTGSPEDPVKPARGRAKQAAERKK